MKRSRLRMGWKPSPLAGLAGCATLLGVVAITVAAIAAPRPEVRPGAIGVAPGRAASAHGFAGTTLYDNTGNPSDTYYAGQGGNEAIDDLHLTAGGSLDQLVFECYDPETGGTFSATVKIYGNPSGLDLAVSPLLGTYEVAGIPRGRQLVSVPLSDAPVVGASVWVGVQFSSATAGLIIQSVPSVGSSHDLYVEEVEFGGYLYFNGDPKANFALRLVDLPEHGLTLLTAGQGTVTKNPDRSTYVEGTVVQLTPNPADHWNFVGWSGDASGADNPLSLVMDGDKTITATFALDTHTLTYVAGPNGTISGTNPQTVEHGSNGTPVTAVGDAGYHFASWSDGVPTATRTDQNVAADLSATATFARDNLACNGDFEVDLAGWAKSGSVDLTRVAAGAARVAGRADQEQVVVGLRYRRFANCIAGTTLGDTYRFTAWVKAGSSSSRNRKVKLRIYENAGSSPVGSYVSTELKLSTVWQKLALDYVVRRSGTSLSERILYDPDKSGEFFYLDDVGIELLPPPVRFTITASALAGGSITPSGAVTVNQGNAQAFTITPHPDYQIQDVVLDGTTSVGPVSSYTFTDVQADRAIQASFIAIPPGQNLVSNPSFESGIQNWIPYDEASLSWNTADGHTGGRSLRVTGEDASNGIDDSPNWVPRVAGVGAKYRFKAWVKAGNASSRGKVKIRVYEYNGSSQVGSTVYSQELPLTADWQLLIAAHTVRKANTALSMRVTTSSDDQIFLVDDVSIERVGLTALMAERGSGLDAAPVLEFARPTVYPNPAPGGATLGLSLATPGVLKAELYDVAGRLIRVLVDRAQAAAGTHRFALGPGREAKLGAGIYFYRAEVDGVRHRGRFVILE